MSSRSVPSRWTSVVILGAAAAVALGGCTSVGGSSQSTSASPTAESRAVVIVSGGGATTPFTTPTQACSADDTFLSAGNTATGLRDYLLAQGKQVYTAPTMADWGVVAEPAPTDFGPFAKCPIVLPEIMTIMSAGDISEGGEHLARFVQYLHDQYGVTDVDFVGHSNGGLWSRSATWVMKNTNAPVTVRSITTLGTPHEGSVPGRYTVGEIDKSACMGAVFCERFNDAWVPYAGQGDKGINREDSEKYLMGPDGWNAAQGNVLDGIPVTLLAGTMFEMTGGDPSVWPNDAIVSLDSAWASRVPDAVIPHRACWSAPLTHSIFVSEAYNVMMASVDDSASLVPPLPLDWQTALTWNTAALARVNQAIDDADSALQQPNRQGCS